MSQVSALFSLGENIVAADKEGQVFAPLIALGPILAPIMAGGSLGSAIDALPENSGVQAQAVAIGTLIAVIGDLLADPKYAPSTKSALKDLVLGVTG